MIRAVTFDVWETMIQDEAALSEERSALRVSRMAEVLRRSGTGVDDAKLRRAYDDSWRHMEGVWVTGREVDTPEQIATVLRLIDPTLTGRLDEMILASLVDAYVDPIHDRPPRLAPDLPAVLDGLCTRGLPLGLICNTGRTPGYAMRRLLGDQYDVLHFFAALAFSNEERVRKPDPAIFRQVLDQLGVAAADAVHVGDDLGADILGAKRTGMRAILIGQKTPSHPSARPDAQIRALAELPEALRQLDSWGMT